MNINYIKNNISLLDLIKVDVKTYIKLHKALQNYDLFDKCKKKFDADNKDFDFDKIELEDLFYITSKHKDMLTDTLVEKKIQESEIFFREPNFFRTYLQNCSSALLFLFHKDNKLFPLLEKLNTDLFEVVLNKISIKLQLDYVNYLINNNSNIIFPKNQYEDKRQIAILSKFRELPETIRPYISHNNWLLSKIKKEETHIEKINNLLKNNNWLKEDLKQNKLNKEELDYLYKEIKPKHLTISILDYLPQDLKEKLYVNMTVEEFDRLFFYEKESIEKFFLENINLNLYLIKDLSPEFMKKHYKKIRESILNGTKIGKQGLKYFLVKNKKKLDKELLEYVLKKYPRFYNSLKIKIDIDFDTTPYEKSITLKDCLFKKELNEKELNFVNDNIEKLMRMSYQNNFSNTIKKIMLSKIEN